ncbi:biotin carboxylase N-terminal domain-containing protein [Aeromicrobium sp. CF3.5]|uniref:acetyl/propionyl/methylcrotonyl-CoA carboxylase subunit alpha n=1 Tax=Aeromicrobium sp. CF3.5 TaxID=3373078 RepID=UPI003EE4613E
MITSVLVANRGEIARRVFRTCRDLGLSTVAVHSDADADAPFVREADRAVRLAGNSPADTYLRGDLVIAAAQRAGADAIHPGYGFLSENAGFARQVIDAGLTWIGPNPDTIDQMGSKIRAKELMVAAGVPILSVDPTSANLSAIFEKFGPLLVKASAGGGGRGMRVVTDPADLAAEMTAASAEARSTFGDETVFVEPYLPGARHVEVQVMADSHGTVWVVGDRDCSIQRRHQKVVEEAPAPNLADATRTALHDAARAAAIAVGYLGAGTVEFLVDDDRFFFLEMNTRLQVEHPVTEEVFGVDLVAAQIAVAEGEELGAEPTGPRGHAVEVRLYAEDPADDWAPQTGTLRTFDVPLTAGIRVDSAVETGSTVGIHYDAMVAKIIAHGSDRRDAIRRLSAALRRSRIHGLTVNRDLLLAILADDDFVAERLSTALLDQRLAEWTAPAVDDRALRKAALAAALAEAETASTQARVLRRIPPAFRNVPSQPRVRTYEPQIAVEYSGVGGRLVQSQVERLATVSTSPNLVVLDDDGVIERFDVTVGHASDSPGSGAAVDVDGPDGSFSFVPVPDFVDPADVVAEGSLLAPMPAAVVDVAVTEGQTVSKGDVIVVLEAMKMQHTITAPTDGVVAQLDVTSGAQVESGAVLAVIDSAIIEWEEDQS